MSNDPDQHLPLGFCVENYEVRAVLGIGGFGITYKAWDSTLERWVALKEFLPADLALRDTNNTTVRARSAREQDYRYALDRFLLEARTLARFQHPNIVRVVDFLQANGTAYLMMEYVEGQALSTYLRKHPDRIPEERLRSWFVPLLTGLAKVHDAGFLHRDIKPGNIYLTDEGVPILIDFGAARQAIGEHSKSVTGIFTAGYAPIEQYATDAKNQGPWTDLYAVGATLYRCVSRQSPVDAPTRQSTLLEGEADPLTPAIDLPGPYSPQFLSLIDELLVLAARHRPQSASVVLTALEQDVVPSHVGEAEEALTEVSQEDSLSRPAASGAVRPGAGRRYAVPAALVAVVVVAVILAWQWLRAPDALVGGAPQQSDISGPESPPAAEVIAAAEEEVPKAVREVQATPIADAPIAPPPEQKRRGSLTLEVQPAHASVTLPGIQDKYSPGMSLPVGSYRLVVRAPRYETYDRDVEVSGAGTRLVIALEQALSEQVGKVFHDSLASGGKGPEMTVLPRGSFRMGCQGEKTCTESEMPVRTVSIMRPIAMMKYEVTFEDFDRYVNATGEPAPNDAGWGRGRNPVIDVNWQDARGYADWLSAQTGVTYRLPSEAEWEYAARAGTQTVYSWGDDIERSHANYGSDKCCQGKSTGADRWEQTAPVGSFGANPWGLHDMSGNVWEWVQDCYNLGYLGAPDDGQPRERCSTQYRIIRGGSWEGSPHRLRLALRGGRDPGQRRDVYGFRLVREL